MKNWKILIVCLIAGLIIWLSFNVEFDDQNLGGGYYYLPAYVALDVGYPNGAIIYKSPQKYLFKEVKVQAEVIQVKRNDKYITVQRKPIADSITIEDLEYYIINKEMDKVYGPYNRAKYEDVSKEFGIYKDLLLE